jgi:hypothetical protein
VNISFLGFLGFLLVGIICSSGNINTYVGCEYFVLESSGMYLLSNSCHLCFFLCLGLVWGLLLIRDFSS